MKHDIFESMKILHLSDLHFGTGTAELNTLLQKTINSIAPDLVIISGDFTQNATNEEFSDARNFLNSLKYPWQAIPGNHDISRYNLIERFSDPYRHYRTWISQDIQPVYRRNGVCIVGLNTARNILPHWNWAHGAISSHQMEWLAKQYAEQAGALKICFMHHPVWKVMEAQLHTIVFGGHAALNALKAMKVNLVLSGHVHHAGVTALPIDDKNKIVFVSASTALSRRLRGQKNGFNIINLYPDRMIIELHGYATDRFEKLESHEHRIY